jgi:hypothetical protein
VSVRVSALVWETDLPPHLRYTLLAYADHANDDGESVYPGEVKLIRKTGYKTATIRRNTKALIDLGMLVQEKRGHRGQRAEYRIDMSILTKAAHFDTQTKGDHPHDERGSSATVKGVPGDTPNHQRTISEPSGRRRDLLWETFVAVHGEPATPGERGKYNATVKKLRDASVSPEEYPTLVVAFTTKHNGLQPGVATVAERIGELRHFVKRGPVQNRSLEDLAEDQRWAALAADEPNTGGKILPFGEGAR